MMMMMKGLHLMKLWYGGSGVISGILILGGTRSDINNIGRIHNASRRKPRK
jgi:hypothetical protein